MEEKYVGLDLHRKYSQIAVLNSEGDLLAEDRLTNDPIEIREYFSQLSSPVEVAVEATGNWYWLVDLLESCECKVSLVHPKRVKAIASAKIKTDKIDAKVLAHLLRLDYLPTSYVPPAELRELRELVRYRCFLVRKKTSLKNRLHSLLAKRGLSHTFSDVFGKRGREWLEGLSLGDIYRTEMNGILGLVDHINNEVKNLGVRIKEEAKANELTRILLTLPGFGHFSSLLVYSEIVDVERFADSKHLCSYSGLVPSVHSSGGKTYYGHITKEGSRWLRWILIQAVPKTVKKDRYLASYYMKTAQKHGTKGAKVAVARKLLKSIYHMLKNKEPYNPTYPRRSLRVRVSSC